ncbi:methyltransferase [Pseudomonas sp. NCHU5208]|uniref:methyltransferase n=1 Tax=unclassified Pseudomonas TaxID=196821 RepID=UPI003F9A085E
MASPQMGVDPLNTALYGFMATALLLEGDRLKIFAHLAEGPTTAAKLAPELGLNEQALVRYLNGASCWGLVSRDGDQYVLSRELGPVLDPASADYLGPLFNHFRENTVPLFAHLAASLCNGLPQWSVLADERGDSCSPFDHIFADDERAAAFHGAMWNLSYGASRELVALGLVDGIDTLVDLGGGAGSLAIAAAEATVNLKARVFDLPAVEPHCRRYIDKAGLAERVGFMSGDFWQSPLPPADAYALGFILSDYDDERCLALLRRVREALGSGGRVLVLERLLDEQRAGPFMGVMQDLAMMLETGGMHRTESHYRRLLEQAGFGDVRGLRSTGEKHAVIGYC